MKINDLQKSFTLPFQGPKPAANDENNPFTDVFQTFVKQVNQDQNNAANMTDDFINGKDVEIHDVMVAGEKAKTSLDLLMQIRNSAIDMYRELSRMQ